MAPGFWDDSKKAQVVTRKRAGIEQKVDQVEKLTRDINDAQEMLELGAAETDDSICKKMPFNTMLSGRIISHLWEYAP